MTSSWHDYIYKDLTSKKGLICRPHANMSFGGTLFDTLQSREIGRAGVGALKKKKKKG